MVDANEWGDEMDWEESGNAEEYGMEVEERVEELKKMNLDDIRPAVLQKMESIKELFALDTDSLVKIARHFRWSEEKMETVWFEQKDKLELQLGIVFDKSLPKKFPQMNASTLQQCQGYCSICYDYMADDNRFSMVCGHTFCKPCWKAYLEKKIDEGRTGIDARCM